MLVSGLGWVGALVGTAEPASPGWRAGVELVAALVDDDVMMKPTGGGEVVGVVVAALGAGDDVVGLEPVPAGTAVDDTAAGAGWDLGGGGSDW